MCMATLIYAEVSPKFLSSQYNPLDHDDMNHTVRTLATMPRTGKLNHTNSSCFSRFSAMMSPFNTQAVVVDAWLDRMLSARWRYKEMGIT